LFGLVAALAWGAGLIVLSAWLLLGGATISIVWPRIWLVALSRVFFTLGTLSLYAAWRVARSRLSRRSLALSRRLP